MTRRRGALGVLLGLCLLLSGCVSLPSSGPVQTVPADQQAEDEPPVDYTPGGPRSGAAPIEIVRGFLVAMQATPLNMSVARRFLTAEGNSSWVPERGTVVYTEETRTAVGDDVRLRLTDTVALDERGTWLGDRGDATYRMHLVREDSQWRISNPPNRLIIPSGHFESRFSQYFLHFFDKTGQVLVPEPVYVPTGAQATTSLVSGLLQGPGRDKLGVVRTFIPARTRLDDISVPVSQGGVAEVPLSDEVLDLDDSQLELVFAQLAWTLAQVPGVERMRVTVDGSPLDLPGEGEDSAVSDWSEFNPTVAWASQSLFGVREQRVVSLVAGEERRISGVFGSIDLGPREIAVDLPGEQVAATTEDGRVLVAPRSRVPGTEPDASEARTVFVGGRDLLRPAWDLYGQLWVLDRTDSGAALRVLRKGTTNTLDVEGVTGEDVRSFAISRDGTRLVAEVADGGRERLVLARIERKESGRVRRLSEAVRIPLGGLGVSRIRDIAWRTPGSVAVLAAPTPDTSQVLVLKVDGSSTTAESTTDAEVFRGKAGRLVTSPVLGAPLYIRTADGQMFSLASNGRWVGAGLEPGLRSPTFVG
ncbi:MAG: LpqB family beta-propeller domain-containing protein [Nocardioides sp.]